MNISNGSCVSPMPHPIPPVPSNLIFGTVAHAFRRGHRIRLQVSGGAHPRYGRNLGTAEPFATSTRVQASGRTVLFHDAQHPLRSVATSARLTMSVPCRPGCLLNSRSDLKGNPYLTLGSNRPALCKLSRAQAAAATQGRPPMSADVGNRSRPRGVNIFNSVTAAAAPEC